MKSDLDTLMHARKLDALVVLGAAEHNPPMYYLTGGGHISSAVLVKKAGEAPVLFYNDMERDEAAKTGLTTRSMAAYPIADLLKEAAGNFSRIGALRIKHILTDMGITRGRLGIYGHVEISDVLGTLKDLQRWMPEIEPVGEEGMDSVFIRAMETKDEGEVERIRRMGKITTEVVRLTQEYLVSRDVREDEVLLDEEGEPLKLGEVKAKIRLWVAERGAELPEGFIFSIGKDAGVPHSTGNPEDLIRLGQTIVYDIYPAEAGGGYFYDFTRTWSLGYAPAEAIELYGQVKEVFDKLLQEFDLNTPFREYQRMTCEYFEAKGHQSQLSTPAPIQGYVHSLGHGVGLNIHERPFSGLPVGDDHRLAAGVVITSEPGLYYPDRGIGFRIEDTFWVRPDGQIELLADYPYDFVIPMKKWKKPRE
jgi:Xaa-Pro aminopeptidase